MPRNVRNWWIEADIEGRKSALSGGPQAKDGGISLRILQRDNGDITTALRIEGYAKPDGQLVLRVEVHGEQIEVVTNR